MKNKIKAFLAIIMALTMLIPANAIAFAEDEPVEPPITEECEHEWGEAVFSWSGYTAIATRVCTKDSSHTETVDAVITETEKTEATNTTAGEITVTATATFEDETTATDEKIKPIPAKGYTYAFKGFEWSADGKSAQAVYATVIDEDNTIKYDAAVVSETLTPATCLENGTTRYTATYKESETEIKTDTKDVEDIIAKGSHNYGEEGAARYTCTVCGTVDEDLKAAVEAADKAAADQAAANAVADVINSIPATVTTADKNKIEGARDAYDALTDDQKALVDSATLTKLTDAEAALAAAEKAAADQAAADAAVEKINAIPATVTTADKDKIEAARAAYDALTDDQKALVDSATLTKLTDAEAAINRALFNNYKDTQKAAADDKAQEGDSDEATELITNAKKDIDALTYDSTKTLDENKDTVDDIIRKLGTDLTNQRAADVVIAKIKALPEAEKVTTADFARIKEARDAYEALTDDQKAKISKGTLDTLEDVEAAFKDEESNELKIKYGIGNVLRDSEYPVENGAIKVTYEGTLKKDSKVTIELLPAEDFHFKTFSIKYDEEIVELKDSSNDEVISDVSKVEKLYFIMPEGDVELTLEAEEHTNAEPVEENKDEATCTEAGSYESVVYCSICGKELSREKIDIPAKEHSYKAVVTEPTCTEKGYTTYTCEYCGDVYVSDYKNEDGHDWGEVTYSWADDNSTCTATRVCKRDEDHTETETVDATVTKKEATCTETGSITYTAEFENKAFEQKTKEVEIPALGHDWERGTCNRCKTEDNYKSCDKIELSQDRYFIGDTWNSDVTLTNVEYETHNEETVKFNAKEVNVTLEGFSTKEKGKNIQCSFTHNNAKINLPLINCYYPQIYVCNKAEYDKNIFTNSENTSIENRAIKGYITLNGSNAVAYYYQIALNEPKITVSDALKKYISYSESYVSGSKWGKGEGYFTVKANAAFNASANPNDYYILLTGKTVDGTEHSYRFLVNYKAPATPTTKKSTKKADVIDLVLSKTTIKRSAKKLTFKATLKINGKAVKGKEVTFKIAGKKFTAKTNKKGVAKLVIKGKKLKSLKKKLKKGKKVKYQVSYGGETVKKSTKVKK